MKKVLELIIMIAGWTTLFIHLYINQTSFREEFRLGRFRALSIYFSYFTVLSNYLVTLSLTIPLFVPHSRLGIFLSKPITRSGILVYIALVGVMYHLILADQWDPKGIRKLTVAISHDVVPPLFVVYWFLYVPKGTLPSHAPFLWVILPILYAVYILLRGALINIYPYPFMDISEKGIPEVLLKSTVIIGLFLGGGFLVVWLDKLLG